MSRQKAGLQKEHDLAAEIYDATGGSVIPLRAGWSGNSSPPMPDLLIPYKGSLRAVEVKTSSQDRYIVTQEDVEDVIHWSMEMTEVPTYPYLSMKFTYYEMVTMRLPKPWDIEASFEQIAEDCPLDARVTRTGNISFGHPSEHDSDVIGSTASEGDGIALLRDLRNDSYANVDVADMETVGVHDIIKEHPSYWEEMG